MKNLYVLLVGINDYAPPTPKLKGCVKDIDQIEKYLEDFCSTDYNLQIRRLENATATYGNVIKGFREHLGQAGPDDIAWFHYSGHGSEEKTAPEFLSLEPNGKDQTLMCVDSGKNGVPHLADKELAVLIYELTARHGSKPPHILVSLDCCHSGSGTRDAGEDMMWTSRAAPSSGNSRTLDSYVDGYYSKQSRLEVPTAKHLLLSACRSVQLAGDMPTGGAFTTGFIKALRAAKGNVSYNDLFIRARASVQQVRDTQTPQFETILNFDPYTRFLEGSPTGERDLYEMVMLEGKWYARCGAINGLPTKLAAPIEVDVYSPPPEKELKGTGKISLVGAQLSRIDMDGGFGVGNFFRQLANSETMYFASIRQLPLPPEMAKVTGDAVLTQTITGNAQKPKHIAWAQAGEPASIDLQIQPNGITIMDLQRGSKAFTTDAIDQDSIRSAFDALDKIALWRRFIELQNKNAASRVKDMYRFEMQEINEEGAKKKHAPGDLRIYADSKQLANRLPAFLPTVYVDNIQQNLYFYLFFVAFDYSISCPGGEIIYRADEHENKSNIEIPLWKKALGWGPAKDNVEDTCYFKLLVTTESLDYQQFLQGGLSAHRDILGEPTPEKVFDDWATSMFAITMVRQDNAINAGTDVSLADGNVKIKAHPSLSGSVSIGKVESNARGSDSIHAFSNLVHGDQALLDFGSSRSLQTQQVIEINNIQMSDDVDLEQQPLEIEINQVVEDGSMLLPVAFDGQHFRVIGDVDTTAEGTQVRIREIPDVDQAHGMGERGILKNLKMCFCKVALGQEQVNQLRWVDLEDGRPVLKRESLGLKIGKAKKVLLVLHGFGGDCEGIIKSLYGNMPEVNLKSYDLILAYDYECLNTPLQTTAVQLKKTLTEFGFGTNDKKMTIISHSLGGLVARWMIEQDGASSFVEHCILVGTPNNGSLYGRIDAYRKWAQAACELAINFVPSSVPFSSLLMKFFKTASDLGGTIAQIDPDSDFVNKLNSSKDPGIKYTVISGDATNLDVEGSGYNGFLEKAKQRLSNWMNKDEPNDLFAPVRSLQCKELWEGRNPENKIMDPVVNHHFGYFVSPEGTRDAKNIWTILSEEI